jgi:acyl transferase domain-containing protein
MSRPRLGGSRRTGGGDELVVLAADSQRELAACARDAAEHARRTDLPLREWAADTTAAHRDGALALAVVGSSCSQVSDKLRHAAERLGDPACVRINDRSGIFFTAEPLHPSGGRVALLFPGEGSQYPRMLAELCIRFPEARQAFDRADRAFEHHPRGLLPSQLVFGEASPDRIWDMDAAVEMVFTGNAAVHAVLGALELKPAVVVGHSTGDYSALFAAGAIQAAGDSEVVELMLGLNTVYQQLANAAALPERALLAVGAGDASAIERALELVPGLDLAMDNCPHQRVLCGAPHVLGQARERLAAEGALVEELAFRRGYHTEAFRPALPLLQPFFQTLPLQAPTVELWSCASAARVPTDLEQLRALALEQWAMPVRFTDTIRRLWDEGVRIFVESGPRGNLTAFVKDILRDRPHLAVACDGANRPTVSHLLFALGQLAAHRVPMNLAPLRGARIAPPPARGPERPARRSSLVLTLATGWPEIRLSAATASKFGQRRPEVERPEAAVNAAAPPSSAAAVSAGPQDPRAALMASHLAVSRRLVQAQERVLMHFLAGPAGASPSFARPLLGDHLHRQGDSLTARTVLSVGGYPFLAHHTLGGFVSAVDPALTGLPVMPFTMTLELAAEAALELVPGHVCVGFDHVVARRWIALEPGGHAQVDVVARRRQSSEDGVISIAVTVGASGSADGDFSANVRLAPSYPPAPAARRVTEEAPVRWDRDHVYRRAMFHGPLFRGIERVTRIDEDGADAVLEVLDRRGLMGSGQPTFAIDPVLLDQPGQVVGVWTADRLTEGFVIFPTRLARLELFSPPLRAGSRVGCRAAIRLTGDAGVVSDLDVDDGAGRIHARFTGWEDKRFDVPASFLAFMLDPRRSSLCRPLPPSPGSRGEAISAQVQVRLGVADLPAGFAARGGIWQQVLAALVLSARERELWAASISSSAEAGSWLLCRLAAKDAARRWLAGHGQAVPPADIVVTDGAGGKLRAGGAWTSRVGGPIEVTVSERGGEALAVAHAPQVRTSGMAAASPLAAI